MKTRAPIYEGLTILCVVIAVVALVLAVLALGEITQSRRQSATDSCHLIRGLVLTATPKSRLPTVQAYIANTPLHDCGDYAKAIVR